MPNQNENKVNIQNLKSYHSDSYSHYYQSTLSKDIKLYILNKGNINDHFWRGELSLELFERKEIEVFFYVKDNEQVTDSQQELLDNFIKKKEEIKKRVYDKIQLIYHESQEPIPSTLAKAITNAHFTISEKDKIEVEIWAALDTEHPAIDYEVFDLSVNPIKNWQTIDDHTAIILIQEMLDNLENDTILDRNGGALEKRYSKTEGTLSDMIFYQDMTNSQDILKELKKDTTIYL